LWKQNLEIRANLMLLSAALVVLVPLMASAAAPPGAEQITSISEVRMSMAPRLTKPISYNEARMILIQLIWIGTG
jgi:hypothetical protein